MKVLVVGAGPVGRTNSIGLSRMGHEVTCLDSNSNLLKPENFLYQPVQFVRSLEQLGDRHLDAILICVGTPNEIHSQDQQDLQDLHRAVIEVAQWASWSCESPPLFVVRSTILPGTSNSFILPLLEREMKDHPFHYAFMPEFLREGSELLDFSRPDRIVVGSSSAFAFRKLKELFVFPHCPWIETNPATAEMIKYVSNVLLTLQISATNEFADVCRTLPQVDIVEVMKGSLLDHRWALGGIKEYLHPGIGFGGSCLPKDLAAFTAWAASRGVAVPTLKGAETTNNNRIETLVQDLKNRFGSIRNLKILQLGLSFKPGTSDLRCSKSIELAERLIDEGVTLTVHDPSLKLSPVQALWTQDWRRAANAADFILLATPWPEYLDLQNLNLDPAKIVDCRRALPAVKAHRPDLAFD